MLGRRDDAFELAFEMARNASYRDGFVGPLFGLYNRANRSQDLIDYFDERWTSLDAFATDYPQGPNGYGLMADLALAYSRTGDTENFANAISKVEQAMTNLSDQGSDNYVFEYENAKYLALAGEYDEAITKLEQAIGRGLQVAAPIAKDSPMFEPLQDNPRFVAAEAAMIENINNDREVLGLDAIDPYKQFWQ